MKSFFKKVGHKFAEFFRWLFKQLKDVKNLIIFIIVFLILSSEVWLFYLLGIITGNAWFLGIASACWLFWLGPFTPFLPICIALTLGIRRLIEKISGKKSKKENGDKTADNGDMTAENSNGARAENGDKKAENVRIEDGENEEDETAKGEAEEGNAKDGNNTADNGEKAVKSDGD